MRVYARVYASKKERERKKTKSWNLFRQTSKQCKKLICQISFFILVQQHLIEKYDDLRAEDTRSPGQYMYLNVRIFTSRLHYHYGRTY